MATITINIHARGITALCARYGYQTTVNGVPNPQSPQDFVKEWLKQTSKAAIRDHEVNTAASTAATAAGTDVDNNIPIT